MPQSKFIHSSHYQKPNLKRGGKSNKGTIEIVKGLPVHHQLNEEAIEQVGLGVTSNLFIY